MCSDRPDTCSSSAAPSKKAGGRPSAGNRRSGKLSGDAREQQKRQLSAAVTYMKEHGLGKDAVWKVANLAIGKDVGGESGGREHVPPPEQRRWPLVHYMTLKRYWEKVVSETPGADTRAILTPKEEEDLVQILVACDDDPNEEPKDRREIRALIADALKLRLQ